MPRRESRDKIRKRMNAILLLFRECGKAVTVIDDNRGDYPTDPGIWHIELAVNTQCGVWNVNIYDDWVATQFDSGTGYQLATGDSRSYSHKHNFHWGRPLPPTDEILNQLKRFADRVLSAEPTPEQLSKILSEQNDRLIRLHQFRGYLGKNQELELVT